MRSTAAVLLLLLSACGGGGDATDPSSEECMPKTVQVQIYGDSTNEKQAANVQEFMDARFGAGTVVVEGRAVPATNSRDLVLGDGRNAPWPVSVEADLVIVNHGLNDAWKEKRVGWAEYERNLRLFSRSGGLVLQTPNPFHSGGSGRTAGYPAKMREVATDMSVPIADVEAFVLSVPGWESMYRDKIHPKPELLRRIALEVMGPALEPMVAKLRCE